MSEAFPVAINLRDNPDKLEVGAPPVRFISAGREITIGSHGMISHKDLASDTANTKESLDDAGFLGRRPDAIVVLGESGGLRIGSDDFERLKTVRHLEGIYPEIAVEGRK